MQPDLFVIPPEEATGEWADCQTLLAVVEVLSRRTSRSDRVTKRDLYRERGVADYWIVDPDARVVEVWRPDDDRPAIATESVAWQPAGEADPLTISLSELFADIPA